MRSSAGVGRPACRVHGLMTIPRPRAAGKSLNRFCMASLYKLATILRPKAVLVRVIQNVTKKEGKNGPTSFPFSGVKEYGDRMNGVIFDPVELTAFRPLNQCSFRLQGLHWIDLRRCPRQSGLPGVNPEARNKRISIYHLPRHHASRPCHGFAAALESAEAGQFIHHATLPQDVCSRRAAPARSLQPARQRRFQQLQLPA